MSTIVHGTVYGILHGPVIHHAPKIACLYVNVHHAHAQHNLINLVN